MKTATPTNEDKQKARDISDTVSWDIMHFTYPPLPAQIAQAIADARAEEREACASLARSFEAEDMDDGCILDLVADAILHRGETK